MVFSLDVTSDDAYERLTMIRVKFKVIALLSIITANFCSALSVNIPLSIKPYTSIVIKRVTDGATIYQLNPNVPRLIASNVKLFTTAFVLHELKPDFKWQTRLYYTGSVHNQELNGNLYLVGGGDPTLDNRGIYTIFAQLKQYGITKINGNIILDSSLFNQLPKYSFLKTDAYDSDTILPHGLMINHEQNFLQLKVSRGAAYVNSDLYGFRLINHLQVSAQNTTCDGIYDKVHINKHDDMIELTGIIPASCNNKTLTYHLLSNFSYNRSIVYKVLSYFNVDVSGDVISGKCDTQQAKFITAYDSPSLLEVLIHMNRYSDNLFAETCLLSVGAFTTSNQHTYSQAQAKMRSFLLQRDLIAANSTIENGAGLSRLEFFTTNQVTKLLVDTYNSGKQPYFMASLAVPLQDGTLKNRFIKFSNNVYAKTGTLNDTQALAGYFRNKFGEIYAFSVVFNSVDIYSGKRNLAIDGIIEDIFTQLNVSH